MRVPLYIGSLYSVEIGVVALVEITDCGLCNSTGSITETVRTFLFKKRVETVCPGCLGSKRRAVLASALYDKRTKPNAEGIKAAINGPRDSPAAPSSTASPAPAQRANKYVAPPVDDTALQLATTAAVLATAATVTATSVDVAISPSI